MTQAARSRRVPTKLAVGLASLLCCVAALANPSATSASAPNTDPTTAATETPVEVFLKLTLTPPWSYVQSAVSIKVQVYSDRKLLQATVDWPGTPDALIQRVGKDVSSQETRNGRSFQVITRHYALLPQRSGEITLDGPVLDAEVPDGNEEADPILNSLFSQLQISGGFGATRPVRRHGDPIRLSVRPQPAGVGRDDWLPAQQLSVEDIWPPADAGAAAGQPLTRRLVLSAVGLSAQQLPDLSTLLALPPGLKAYPGEPTLTDDTQDGRIHGRREQDIALIADHGGRFETPALRLAWWDVTADQPRLLEVAAHVLAVTGDAPAPAPAPAPAGLATDGSATVAAALPASPTGSAAEATAPVEDTPPGWLGVGLGIGLLALGTLAAGVGVWARRQRGVARGNSAQRPVAPRRSAASARREFLRACGNNRATAARAALLAWADATWPQQAPVRLHALADLLADATLAPRLHMLERACLMGGMWDGAALAQALPSRRHRAPSTTAPRELPGLYSEADASPQR